MNNDNRHKLFLLCLTMTDQSSAEFAESLGVSRQAVSQAVRGVIASKPILTKIDSFIEENLPKLRELVCNGVNIGVYRLSEYEDGRLLLSMSDGEAMEFDKKSLVKLFDKIY